MLCCDRGRDRASAHPSFIVSTVEVVKHEIAVQKLMPGSAKGGFGLANDVEQRVAPGCKWEGSPLTAIDASNSKESQIAAAGRKRGRRKPGRAAL